MRSSGYRLTQVLLLAAVTVFPVLFADRFERHEWGYIVGFVCLALAMAVMEVIYDRQSAHELEQAHARQIAAAEVNHARHIAEIEMKSQRLAAQTRRGTSMSNLMKLILPTATQVEQLTGIARQLKQQNSPDLPDILNRGNAAVADVISNILKAVSEEVRAYWDAADGDVNSCLMIGRELHNCSRVQMDQLQARAHFLGYGRVLASYKAALELVSWAARDLEVPELVLPVDDPSEWAGRTHLLPGAPQAYALGQDEVIADTARIESYCPPGLEPDLRAELRTYFEKKRFRSFMSVVLHDGGPPLGVLNVQFNKVNIGGAADADKEILLQSLAHFRASLGYLLGKQRTLMEMAS